MIKQRQDAWTSDEDTILADIVLDHIKNGKTQLNAFKEAGAKLARTPAACGYRWNASLRKKYSEGIEMAKRNLLEHNGGDSDKSNQTDEDLPIDQVISLLEKLKIEVDRQSLNPSEKERLIELEKENKRLLKHLQHYEVALAEIHNIWNWTKKMNIN